MGLLTSTTLASGEDKAFTSFVLENSGRKLVVCVGVKCVAFDTTSNLDRTSDVDVTQILAAPVVSQVVAFFFC
jgi:hypothetical protein